MSLDRGIYNSSILAHERECVFYSSQYSVDNHQVVNDGVAGALVSVQSDVRSSMSVLLLVAGWLQLLVLLPALDSLSRPLQRWEHRNLPVDY